MLDWACVFQVVVAVLATRDLEPDEGDAVELLIQYHQPPTEIGYPA
jgi:hypothetical protein